MDGFINDDFLLSTKTSRDLYEKYAKGLPIIDYHCHINPKDIYEDKRFRSITEIWLGGDHYKWRLMRANGIEEKYITGEASDRDKFQKWAETLAYAIGNPLYHWSHIELKRFFGYEGILKPETAEEVWELSNEILKELSTRKLIEMSNVEIICTTDDPIDTLEWHKKIKADDTFKVRVIPAWRPDKAMNIEKKDFKDYITKLEAAAGVSISSFKELIHALKIRLDFFAENGCRLSDHALEDVMYREACEEEIEEIFSKKMNDADLEDEDVLKYKTAFMLIMAEEYRKRDWAMQLHYGCVRDINTGMFDILGPDTGYDAINNYTPTIQLAQFLNAIDKRSGLPRTIVYSLNPIDNDAIDTVIGGFNNSDARTKMQHGSAWWFNDHLDGMRSQLCSFANKGFIAGFIGMLTDSRSFLSYPRHEYFRRVLCGLFGEWVEDGLFPNDKVLLGKIVSDICYQNAKDYFRF